ncbi:hypothetical protein L5515_013131 [Caenorhabditis briggsae]|uniref:VTT domain-containing protein n=1 Tax=Caenorhabditis briggsae TaxID=6238 RepID=A0AAE9E8B1_CAEBR|nr:hypothetical protein L5515_013131 [Caenorhabditis briggsae]
MSSEAPESTSRRRQKPESPPPEVPKPPKQITSHPWLVLLIFISFAVTIYTVYSNFPQVAEDERPFLKYPRNLEDAKNLGRVLSKYKENNYDVVLGAICVIYCFLQSFAIPGSIFLTILSGYLFPFHVALLLVCSCSALGAAVCFQISNLLGKALILRLIPERVSTWQEELSKHRDNFLHYMIFLRVTPILPNWFINIVSPVLDVPLSPFFWGTFLGVAPPSFLYIQAGSTLEQLTHTSVAWSWSSVGLLTVAAGASLAPILWKKWRGGGGALKIE